MSFKIHANETFRLARLAYSFRSESRSKYVSSFTWIVYLFLSAVWFEDIKKTYRYYHTYHKKQQYLHVKDCY